MPYKISQCENLSICKVGVLFRDLCFYYSCSLKVRSFKKRSLFFSKIAGSIPLSLTLKRSQIRTTITSGGVTNHLENNFRYLQQTGNFILTKS